MNQNPTLNSNSGEHQSPTILLISVQSFSLSVSGPLSYTNPKPGQVKTFIVGPQPQVQKERLPEFGGIQRLNTTMELISAEPHSFPLFI